VPRAYVASPYGFSAATRAFYDDVVLPALRAAGVEPLDPWADPGGAVAAAFAAAAELPPGDARTARFAAINARLGAANADSIRAADGVLAILDGVDVDSGTAAEIGFAAALGKPVVGLRLDTRRTGDNEGARVNLQVEHFIRAGGGAVCGALDDAVARLAEALGGAP
jgi:nucleoside 2-deoxyribosyltransferase